MVRETIKEISLLLALIFGGLLSIASILLFHAGYFGWAIICFIGVAFTWFLDNEKAGPIIAIVFVIGGIIELNLGNYFLGIVALIIALIAYFCHGFNY